MDMQKQKVSGYFKRKITFCNLEVKNCLALCNKQHKTQKFSFIHRTSKNLTTQGTHFTWENNNLLPYSNSNLYVILYISNTMVCTMVYICDNDKWVLARCLKDMSRSSRDVHKNAEAQKRK